MYGHATQFQIKSISTSIFYLRAKYHTHAYARVVKQLKNHCKIARKKKAQNLFKFRYDDTAHTTIQQHIHNIHTLDIVLVSMPIRRQMSESQQWPYDFIVS